MHETMCKPYASPRTDLPPHSWLSCVSQPGLNMERPAPAESISLPVSIFWFRSYSSCNHVKGAGRPERLAGGAGGAGGAGDVQPLLGPLGEAVPRPRWYIACFDWSGVAPSGPGGAGRARASPSPRWQPGPPSGGVQPHAAVAPRTWQGRTAGLPQGLRWGERPRTA